MNRLARCVLLAALPTATVLAVATSSAATPAGAAVSQFSAHAAATCALVTPATIKSDLGLVAAKAQPAAGGGEDVICHYQVGSNLLGVQVTYYQMAFSNFQQVAKAYLSSGAQQIKGIGQSAYTDSIHSTGTSGSDVTFYDHGYDVALEAQVTIAKVETLAKFVDAKL